MGLYDAINASVSGMAAQSNYLANIAQNISNSATVGYKQADTEFSTLVDQSAVGQTSSGGVTSDTRVAVSQQGTLQGTTSATDLAINGNGFFVVSNSAGAQFLTRSGSFVPDASGNLVNSGGFYLNGYSLANGTPTIASNSLAGMSVVNVGSAALSATPTTTGTFAANLPSTDTVIPSATAIAPATTSTYNEKTSIVMYDNLGASQTVNLYLQNNGATTTAGVTTYNWTVKAYNANNSTVEGSASLVFNSSGALTSGSPMSVTIPGGAATMSLDVSGMTQLASSYAVSTSKVNGNAASSVNTVTVGTDGTLAYQLADGSTVSAYKIALADVASPDNLLPVTGNVYTPNILSGQVSVGTAGTGQLGTVKSSQLEQSTVDIATELTNMIVSQRSYQANSQMFKCGADTLSTLIQLNLA